MSNITVQTAALQGWTNSPDSRGSIDIVSSCISTIFLCIWSVLCVNIGLPGESASAKVYQKLKLAVLTILGPDFLLLLVVGQWESARKSCCKFKERGIIGWSMRHAFYADMGGFVARTRDGVTWPLDANQLCYLIDEEWIKEPMVSSQIALDKTDIDDRNKQNTLVRVFTIAQISWFLVNCIARGFQRLPVTTLELTTVGFIATTIGVSIFWSDKPADIETQIMIDIDATIPDIYARAGQDDTHYWYDTPLDFLSPEKTYYEVAWRYCLNILSAMLMLHGDQQRPIRRRRDDNYPAVSHAGMVIVGLAGLFSWGSNLVAWNFEFPTILERQTWRACSLILVAAIGVGTLYHEILLVFFPEAKKKACNRFAASKRSIAVYDSKLVPTEEFVERLDRGVKRLVLRLSNLSPNGDPSLTIQLRVLLPALFCGSAYTIARTYLLVEDLIAFRGQDPDIYRTVNWVAFLPDV
ncbi:hypothetical protein LCER1_G008151 [Lachnellula cervina]|uniref:Uncharacterized protein n=1 Tax=Lachnellula cervina TaxID=1316786 RepID=A0A7D8YYW1_9HELO|nr:hypothetical protein LCER1_G008151 [Lachnellula cervina]